MKLRNFFVYLAALIFSCFSIQALANKNDSMNDSNKTVDISKNDKDDKDSKKKKKKGSTESNQSEQGNKSERGSSSY